MDEKPKWRQFSKLSFNSKDISRRVKKAEGATTRHAHKFIVTRLSNVRSVRRRVIAWLLLVGVMIAAVGVQLVWFQRGYQVEAVADGGTYAEASLGPIDTLNPLYASTDAEVAATKLLFSSLYSYDETGKLTGDLAKNMTVDDSGMQYTLSLRPHTTWHDGTRLTAKDVVFTVNLIKNQETRSPLRINWQDVKVTAVNDTTVRFTLPAVYAAFPHALTLSILPEHILANVPAGGIRENAFSRSPVGSGPFSFRLLQSGDMTVSNQVVHMTAFEKYYKGKPKLSRFEVHAYGTQEDMIKALRSTEVSAASQLNINVEDQLNMDDFTVTRQPVNSGVYALFNSNKPLLKEREVRRALQLATDTTAIRNAIGTNPPALDGPFIKGQLTGKNIPKAAAFDAKRAARVLENDGWKLKNGVRTKGNKPLVLSITTTKNDQYEKVVELLANQWRDIGVDVSVNIVDTSNPATNFIQNTLQPRDYDVLVYELIIGADPDVYAYWHGSQMGVRGYNFSNYSDPVSDAALASARSRLEPALRNEKYKTFAQKWFNDIPAIGLYQPVSQYVASNKVSSVNQNAKFITPADRFTNVLYWGVRHESVYKTP